MTENRAPLRRELNDVQLALIERTNQSYREFMDLGQRAVSSILDFTAKGREVGLDLQTLRASARAKYDWEQLAFDMRDEGEPRLNFDVTRGKALLRLVERLPEPPKDMAEAARSLKDILMIQGSLGFPEDHGHGQQRLHDADPGALITVSVMKIQAIWNKELKGKLDKLDPGRQQFLADLLYPLVKIWRSIPVVRESEQ